MISRRTSIAVGSAYESKFSFHGSDRNPSLVYKDELYDFLFENDFEAWFCNTAKKLILPRHLKEWAMKLHTGETLAPATPNWDWQARERLGQNYLRNLSLTFLNWYTRETETWRRQKHDGKFSDLCRCLELDGFVYRDKQLLFPESDILNVQEERGILHRLYISLELNRIDEAFQLLELSEEHYVASRWEDCISNSRKFFELTMQECASRHSLVTIGQTLSRDIMERPVRVRDYLERTNLLEKKEREMLDKTYGLLSHTGSHPYMANNDQARLLRQVALTLVQFVMLRTEGAMPSK